MTARRRLGGALLLLAVAYLLGEAWAVAGWRGLPYSWTDDAISTLGVPEVMWTSEGSRESTRYAAMNATFVASGVRVLLATVVLAPFVPRWRWLVLPLALAHGIGTVVVGFVPTGLTSERANGHGLGALTATLAARHRGLAAWTGACAAVSVLGCALVLVGVGGFGLAERLAVDAVIIWQIGAGAALLLSRPR